jgi:hypothetical protein
VEEILSYQYDHQQWRHLKNKETEMKLMIIHGTDFHSNNIFI